MKMVVVWVVAEVYGATTQKTAIVNNNMKFVYIINVNNFCNRNWLGQCISKLQTISV